MRLLEIIEKYFGVSKTFQDLSILKNFILKLKAIKETAFSYIRLLCPTWDYYVPYEPFLSHMSLLCSIALFYISLLYPIWHLSVKYETALSHSRLICPI